MTEASSPLLVKALSALERSRLKLEAAERDRNERIAIIGASCRLPGGVVDLPGLWSLFEAGGDAVTQVPLDRWQIADLVVANRGMRGKLYNDAMAVLDGWDQFDPAAFNIAPREAERMDPQQRLLLELSFEALEHAGIAAETLRGTDTGVFVGICANEFGRRFGLDDLDTFSATGASTATASGRISYTFGLQGPALSIDTACSSSLVAVHLACQSLRRKESALALVGGVQISAGPELSVGMARLNALSATGRCRTFSADADGYVRGEGCVVLVLKRFSDAVRDDDRILACIAASATNQDGRSNGLTAPSGRAQTALFRECLSQAKLLPRDVGYLEAHGTGTELGDPIELAAAAAAYDVERGTSELWVGSSKTNFGHLEAAAGLLGLLKAILAIRNKVIPPNLHFNGGNPHFDWDAHALRVPTELTPFPANRSGARVAGVSAFGFSGTNAHVLVEQAPGADVEAAADDEPPTGHPGDAEWMLLSASSAAALQRRSLQLADRLHASPNAWRDLCRTTQDRRGHHLERLAVSGTDAASIAAQLTTYAEHGNARDVISGRRVTGNRGVVAVFSGQGSQWNGMGRELYDAGDVFRHTFDECSEAVRAFAGHSMQTALFASDEHAAAFDSSVVQPLLFSVTVALTEHMRSLGVRIEAAVGQSMGELAAAVAAGALSIEDGARVVCARSRLCMTVSGGAMAVVAVGVDEARALIASTGETAFIAASNGPATTLISGEAGAVEAVLAVARAQQLFCKRLSVDFASHCPSMDTLLLPLQREIAPIAPRTGKIPFYSTVTGRRVEGTSLTPSYWAANLRDTVLFHAAVESLMADGYRLFLEIAPRPALVASIEDALLDSGVDGLAVPAMREDEPQRAAARDAAARLFCRGASLSVPRQARCHADLPTYPWDHSAFPLPAWTGAESDIGPGRSLLRAPREVSTSPGTWTADGLLRMDHPLVTDHRVDSAAIMPGAGFLCMVLDSARELWPGTDLSIGAVSFQNVLAQREGAAAANPLQLVLSQDGPQTARWRLSGRDPAADAPWMVHVQGRVETGHDTAAAADPASLGAIKAELPAAVDGGDLYATLRDIGLQYGRSFRQIDKLWYSQNAFLARLRPTPSEDGRHTELDGFLLDACFHGLAWLGRNDGALAVPTALDRLDVVADRTAPVWVYGVRTQVDQLGGTSSIADLTLWDAKGGIVGTVHGLRSAGLDGPGSILSEHRRWLHAQRWEAQAPPLVPSDRDRDWLIIAAKRAVSDGWLDELGNGLGSARLVRWDRAQGAQVLVEQFRAWCDEAPERPRSIAYIARSVGREPEEAGAVPDGRASVDALLTVQSILRAFNGREPPKLCWVTAGTQVVDDHDDLQGGGALTDSTLWGFARSLSIEHPELHSRCIDLDGRDHGRQLTELAHELTGGSPETEVALRAKRWVGRVGNAPLAPERPPSSRYADEPFRLEIDRPGVLATLTTRTFPRLDLAPGDVEIEVEAAALNFADVMRAMGFFRGPDETVIALGGECIGTVSRLAPDVTEFEVGQRVVALGRHCLASVATAAAIDVCPAPANLTSSAGAGLAIASMTAWYCLKTVAAVHSGQYVLVHSASGGTGLASTRLALSLGATVIVTAGNEQKREMLRSMGLRHVFDSRGGNFEKKVLQATDGAGVDVVLNSLSDVGTEASLRVLAPDGWFLELGKRGIYDHASLPLWHFRKRIRYAAIDLAGLQRERPERFSELFRTVMKAYGAKEISALPTTTVPMSEARKAFQQMAAAQHVGKVVIEMRAGDTPVADRSGPAPLLRGTHVVAGGGGGLGRELCEWLVRNGARRIVLIGRSFPETTVLREQVARLRHLGAEVRTVRADVGSLADLAPKLRAVEADFGRIRGIYHLAGVLDDGLVEQQTETRYERVLHAKVDGAWNLHRLSVDFDLDHFVLYSSAAALLPSASQSSYAAANAFLDALALFRRRLRLPALSIQWGPFSDAGLAAADPVRGERLAARGLLSLTTAQSHRYLGTLMKGEGATIGVFPLDGARWLASSPVVAAIPRYVETPGRAPSQTDPSALVEQLRGATAAVRHDRLCALVRRHVGSVLRTAESEIASDVSFQQLGLDSLTGLELRNLLEGDLTLGLSSAVLWRYGTVDALASHLSLRLSPATGASSDATVGAEPHDALLPGADGTASPWFLVQRPAPQARMRLFCLPHLGGLATVFAGWNSHLPSNMELQAVQLPGRPPRHREASFASFPDMVDGLRAALLPRLDLPYAIYGHSFGALIAFALVQSLGDAHDPLPKHLFLGAYPAPHLHNPLADLARAEGDDFLEGLRRLRGIPEQVLANKELLGIFLPSLRVEVELLDSYRHIPRSPMAIPVTVFSGTRDRLVSRSQVAGWKQHFAGPFDMAEIDGEHLFHQRSEKKMIDIILSRLGRPVADGDN